MIKMAFAQRQFNSGLYIYNKEINSRKGVSLM